MDLIYTRKRKVLTSALLLAMPLIAVSAEENKTESIETMAEVEVQAGNAEKDGLITQERSTTVGKSPVSIQDSPQSISVVDVDRIRETGAVNIQDALTYTSGVYSGNFGFDTRIDSTAVRGLTPSVFLDGLRGLYGFYNNPRSDIYTLESIEVMKGPSSALYGQSDLGGIVNAVSKRPQKEASREVNFQYGANDRKQIATDLTGPITEDGHWLYRLVALKRDSGTQVDYVNDDAVVIMPSITWTPSDWTNVTLQYIHQENDSKVSAQFLPSKGTIQQAPLGRIPSNTFVGEPGWDRYDTEKKEISLFVDQRITENTKIVANLRKSRSSSITREHWTQVGAVPDDAGNIARNIYTTDKKTKVFASDIRLEGDFNLGPTKHTVSLGMDYQDALWEEDNTSFGLGGVINVYNPVYGFVNGAALAFADAADNEIIQTGFYLSDHMEWGPLVLSGAIRRDHAKNTVLNLGASPDSVVRNSATTGRIGMMYRFDNGISPYVNYSEAFVPNLGTDGTATQSYLAPTEGEQKEVGVKYISNDGNTSAAFAWFDIEQLNRVVQGDTVGGVEQIGAATQGWELEVKHRIGDLELLGNYTRMSAFNDSTKKRLSAVAEKFASAWAQYQITPNVRVGLGTRYIGDNVGSGGSPKISSVTLFDAMVGYTVGPWDFRANVRNLADKEFVSWCRGENLDCGYGERLNGLLTANYKF